MGSWKDGQSGYIVVQSTLILTDSICKLCEASSKSDIMQGSFVDVNSALLYNVLAENHIVSTVTFFPRVRNGAFVTGLPASLTSEVSMIQTSQISCMYKEE